MNLFLFDFTKTKTGAKTALRAPKLSYFDRRAPQLSARVNHGTLATGVISHILWRICKKIANILKLKPEKDSFG